VGHGDKDAAGVPHSGYDGRSIFLKMFGSSIFSKIKKYKKSVGGYLCSIACGTLHARLVLVPPRPRSTHEGEMQE
jgi:hypothetical protein